MQLIHRCECQANVSGAPLIIGVGGWREAAVGVSLLPAQKKQASAAGMELSVHKGSRQYRDLEDPIGIIYWTK